MVRSNRYQAKNLPNVMLIFEKTFQTSTLLHPGKDSAPFHPMCETAADLLAAVLAHCPKRRGDTPLPGVP